MTVLERTEGRIESNVDQRQTLSKAYQKSMNTADQLQIELHTRARLLEAVLEAEDRALQMRAQQQPPATVSAPAPTGPVIGVDKSTAGASL